MYSIKISRYPSKHIHLLISKISCLQNVGYVFFAVFLFYRSWFLKDGHVIIDLSHFMGTVKCVGLQSN